MEIQVAPNGVVLKVVGVKSLDDAEILRRLCRRSGKSVKGVLRDARRTGLLPWRAATQRVAVRQAAADRAATAAERQRQALAAQRPPRRVQPRG